MFHTLSPEQISEEAGVQYLEGARISTIGLGHEVNENLLRQIAKNGQGHYYFAEDSTALTKIMREDLKTTIIPVVKNVSLPVKLESGHTFENLYGSPHGSNIKGKTELAATNSGHEMSRDVVTNQQQESGLMKQLILSGLKLAEKSLPGLWSTVATLLIVAIE